MKGWFAWLDIKAKESEKCKKIVYSEWKKKPVEIILDWSDQRQIIRVGQTFVLLLLAESQMQKSNKKYHTKDDVVTEGRKCRRWI